MQQFDLVIVIIKSKKSIEFDKEDERFHNVTCTGNTIIIYNVSC